MNIGFLAAAGLSAVLVPAHIFGGGIEIHLPVLATELAPDIKAVITVVWHAISLILIINTALLVGAAFRKPWGPVAAWIVAAQYAGFVALFVVFGVIRLGNLTQMPQWIGFLLIVVLIGIGLRRATVRQVQA
ncbi:MAG: hypothetical protein GXP03_01610 [Alphaproteobacteria bacterium]|nr:hypothetical protein [Alphaproteobacteria bacterium]